MTKPHFINAAVREELTLQHTRKGWQGCPPAEISLGQFEDGRWTSSASATLSNGSGFGGPLGHWSDGRRVCYASRDAALDAATQRIEKHLNSAPVTLAAEVSRARDWLRSLKVGQGDLFGLAF